MARGGESPRGFEKLRAVAALRASDPAELLRRWQSLAARRPTPPSDHIVCLYQRPYVDLRDGGLILYIAYCHADNDHPLRLGAFAQKDEDWRDIGYAEDFQGPEEAVATLNRWLDYAAGEGGVPLAPLDGQGGPTLDSFEPQGHCAWFAPPPEEWRREADRIYREANPADPPGMNA